MQESLDLGPVELSYAAALRGIRPRVPGTAFAYARLAVTDIEEALCLAASNPEGRFWFFLESEADVAHARELADRHGVYNAMLTAADALQVLERLRDGSLMLPQLDYLCLDETALPLEPTERAAFFDLAQTALGPQGLLAYRYRPFAKQDDSLRYLISIMAPEIPAEQKGEFVQELRALGGFYFARSSTGRTLIDKAIAEGKPGLLLDEAAGSTVASKTMDVMGELLRRQMMYAGDAQIAANYMELSTPTTAHDLLQRLHGGLFYEPVKDFTTDRGTRTDIWCRFDAELTGNPVALFSGFFFGACAPGESLPPRISAQGRAYDLTAPLFRCILALSRTMPIAIGDFLSHASCRDEDGNPFLPSDVVTAVQLLVALGLVTPMRGTYSGYSRADYTKPQLAGSFNQAQMENRGLARSRFAASTVTGRAVRFEAREALVLQALATGGFESSPKLLLPELERIAADPAQALTVLGGRAPDAALSAELITDVCERDMVSWYAFGVLAA